MSKRISILLSTYNEALVIEETLKLIFETIENVEVILVDDNSKDGTLEKVKKFKNQNIKIFSRNERGLASAFLLGLINSTGDVVGWVDSNMGQLIKKFPEMINNLDKYDIVLLSRYINGGSDNRSRLRILSSKIINFFCRLVLSRQVFDYTSSIFVMNRSSLRSVVPIAYGHGEFFIEFLYKAIKSGLTIKEIPYVQSADLEGISKTSSSLFRFFRIGLNYFLRVIIIRFRDF
jgi:glycosyltransferase involved in cell wall biosynthesis|tara:strand:+ start:138 stop:836 length:699 start_codon:yes stop_codon:yes gene_type:complete